MIKDIHVIDGWYNKPSKEIILKHNTGGKVYISVDKLDSHNEFTWYVQGEQQQEQEDPIITPDPQDPDTPEVDTPTYYTVSVAQAEHGTVTVSGLTNGKILEGGKITIEAQPEDGYRLYSLRLVMNDGTDLELYDNINRYTYLIYNNIQIVAGFKANEVYVPDDPEIPDTPQDPDEPTTNPTFPKPSAAVDLGLSVDWSPWNIGGSSATDNTHLYGWGDPTGTVTSTIRGHYAIGLPETSDANIAGNANYDIAAKQWGDGWRMPTKEEFTELYNGCNVETTSVNGQGVYKFINKQDSNKYIVIPFNGGARWGQRLDASDTPFYWTANGVSEDGALKGVNAQLLPTSYEEQHYSKCYGMQIRPVKQKGGSSTGGNTGGEGQQEQPIGEGATQDFTFVDLGLPTHTKWATCNVGAETPLDSGAYFAYGCTEETTDFSQSNYPYYINGAYRAPGGGNVCGNVDYDAAAKVSGRIAQMPTKDQIRELISSCTWEWKERYNGSYTNGYLVTGSNGNSIFMPACGHYGVYMSSGQSELNGAGTTGYYWSGEVVSYGDNLFSTYGNAYCLVTEQPEENTQTVSCPGTVAHSGCCIRPVMKTQN